jgi:hypothetical protein
MLVFDVVFVTLQESDLPLLLLKLNWLLFKAFTTGGKAISMLKISP